MRILVCGGRSFADKEFVFRTLSILYRDEWCKNLPNPIREEDLTIISGCAKGPDTFALQWAVWAGFTQDKYPAEWEKYGKSAGPIRNQQMIDEGKPDLVIAFPGGAGTADMIRRAKKAGIEVKEIKYPE